MAVAAAAAFALGHAVLAVRIPLMDLALALALLCVFAFFPPVCRAILISAVAVGATFNPPLLGLGASGGGGAAGGRVYVVQALLLLVIIGGIAFALRGNLRGTALLVVASAASIVLLQTVGRPHAGPAWTYRPLQLFLVAFAVRALFHHRDHRRLLMALAWGGAVGCALATIHALVPAFDPFTLSRPDNQPFQSIIGNFARATGAFTYPNNLGTFAAYVVLLGSAALLLGRPILPRPLAIFVVAAGGSALLLSGSRAAGLGLLCGLLYLTVKLAPRRRALIVATEASVGLVIVLAVLSSPTAVEVAEQRIDSAAGESLSLRLEGSRTAYEAFRASPLIGTGAREWRTDNFWLLYLAQGGVIGAGLYVVLARKSLRPGSHEKAYPELWVAILVALGTSGLLQDSLGQTLATWFPGVLLGICALAPSAPSREADA